MILVLWAPWRKVPPPARLRFSAELGADASLVTDHGTAAILSPDGVVLAFVAQKQAGGGLSSTSGGSISCKPQPLSGTEGPADPFFSPDGQWIAFFAGGKLKKISVTGARRSHSATPQRSWRRRLGRRRHDRFRRRRSDRFVARVVGGR